MTLLMQLKSVLRQMVSKEYALAPLSLTISQMMLLKDYQVLISFVLSFIFHCKAAVTKH